MVDQIKEMFAYYINPATVLIGVGVILGAVATGAAFATFGWLR